MLSRRPALLCCGAGLLLLLLGAAVAAAAEAAPGTRAPPPPASYVLDYSDLEGKPYIVDFTNRAITFNGKPAILQSGSIHYPRSTPGMWPKLMAEARASGLNTIESYVFWNYHQRELADYTNGRYDYSGSGNVTAFLQVRRQPSSFWRDFVPDETRVFAKTGSGQTHDHLKRSYVSAGGEGCESLRDLAFR
jgi:hypothetical protein